MAGGGFWPGRREPDSVWLDAGYAAGGPARTAERLAARRRHREENRGAEHHSDGGRCGYARGRRLAGAPRLCRGGGQSIGAAASGDEGLRAGASCTVAAGRQAFARGEKGTRVASLRQGRLRVQKGRLAAQAARGSQTRVAEAGGSEETTAAATAARTAARAAAAGTGAGTAAAAVAPAKGFARECSGQTQAIGVGSDSRWRGARRAQCCHHDWCDRDQSRRGSRNRDPTCHSRSDGGDWVNPRQHRSGSYRSVWRRARGNR
mmetsp:Transcript_20499/g.70927  ORF Transcript_20499/g.70927 Transcript_20499/m.70927 type:complete len:262 (-) Transcript_20499:300-1085(-)